MLRAGVCARDCENVCSCTRVRVCVHVRAYVRSCTCVCENARTLTAASKSARAQIGAINLVADPFLFLPVFYIFKGLSALRVWDCWFGV